MSSLSAAQLTVRTDMFARKTKRGIRSFVLRALGTEGHRSNVLIDSIRASRAKQRLVLEYRLGVVLKRLAQAGVQTDLRGKSCVDFGSGYLMADALIFSMLGSETVLALDYNPILVRRAARDVILSADGNELARVAAQYGCSSIVHERITFMKTCLKERGSEGFHQIGISYLAPFDINARRLPAEVDLIYSASVLEHVPTALVPNILDNLASSLNSGGIMIHAINLCDHRDINGAPYDFLMEGTDYDPLIDYDKRGNRLRKSQWIRAFNEMPGLATEVVSSEPPGESPRGNLLQAFSELPLDDVLARVVIVAATRV